MTQTAALRMLAGRSMLLCFLTGQKSKPWSASAPRPQNEKRGANYKCQNKCLLSRATESRVLGHCGGKKCFIAVVRGVKCRLLSFLNCNGLGSVYLSLHLLYETKDSDTKIIFSANFKCPKDPYHIPLEFEEGAGGRWRRISLGLVRRS